MLAVWAGGGVIAASSLVIQLLLVIAPKPPSLSLVLLVFTPAVLSEPSTLLIHLTARRVSCAPLSVRSASSPLF
eukprot:2775469-Pyramimonas_sp.AAC.1